MAWGVVPSAMESLGAYLFTGAFRFLARRRSGGTNRLGDPLELSRFVSGELPSTLDKIPACSSARDD